MTDRLDARATAFAILLAAIWGGSYTMVKLGFRDLPVFGSLLMRVVIVVAVLSVYSLVLKIPFTYGGTAKWYLVVAALTFIWGMTLMYLGASRTTAARSAILFNMQPFFTLLLMPFFVPSERITPRRLAGTAVAFGGVVLVFVDRVGGATSLLGDGLVLLAAVGWSAGTVLNKLLPRHVHSVSVILWSFAGCLPVMAALTLLLERGEPWRFTPTAIVSIVYLGVVAAAFSFVGFMWLIRHYSAVRVNAFTFLSPVFGVLIGWAVLGDPLTVGQALGALGVAAGIYIVNSGA